MGEVRRSWPLIAAALLAALMVGAAWPGIAMFDALGDCVNPGLTPGGLFHNDTRYLSGMQLLIDGQRPLLLSSAVENDNVVLTVDLSTIRLCHRGSLRVGGTPVVCRALILRLTWIDVQPLGGALDCCGAITARAFASRQPASDECPSCLRMKPTWPR